MNCFIHMKYTTFCVFYFLFHTEKYILFPHTCADAPQILQDFYFFLHILLHFNVLMQQFPASPTEPRHTALTFLWKMGIMNR